MKNVFLICVIVALAAGLFYTSTEISELNDQLQIKLEESSSTAAQSSTMEGATAESPTATTEATTTPANVVYTIGDTNYNFPASGLTIEQDTSR